tara:strand:+ start:139 stop:471 length:333 start_codon:yes stop_codon:yes gene_type:complete
MLYLVAYNVTTQPGTRSACGETIELLKCLPITQLLLYLAEMHALLQLLVDALLIVLVVGGYCAYQSYRRRQNEYARVQLYEDADKPFCGASTPEVGGWQGSVSTKCPPCP